ncbi:MAG: Uma2 family endonuclease [Gemmatimonadales bacterium]
MAAPVYYTADMVRALPEDGNRYDVVYGELLVTPAPRVWHQIIQNRLLIALHEYLLREPVGHVMSSRSDLSWRPDLLVSPDLFVAPLEEIRTLDWAQVQDLRLVVEILSPSSVRYDRFTKRRLFQDRGVPVYWVVDGDAHQVEVWAPDASFPTVVRDELRWHAAPARSPFTLDLAELFLPL